MAVEIKVPEVGESITEVQIGAWHKREGEHVKKDEGVVEIESDKATVEVPAPITGVLAKLLKQSGESAAVGEVIGYLEEVSADDQAAMAAAQAEAAQAIQTTPRKEKPPARVEPAAEPAPSAVSGARQGAAQAPPAGGGPSSSPGAPAPAASAAPAGVPSRAASPPERPGRDGASAPGAGHQPLVLRADLAPAAQPTSQAAGREEDVVPMSPIRRRIAQRLVEAQHAAALLTTFNEVNMAAVIALRNEHKEAFQQRYGVKLGFMSFFIKATIDALKLIPQVNAEIRGNDIVYHNYFDIGIAVGGGKGLVVPVLRDADRLSFAEIELAIADLAQRARDNAITLEELQGGTFTISNGGVYGSLLSTPIVNPPQSGILGLHAIQDRPIAEAGQVVIRPMMYVALTYDHRIVDGQGAVTFLRRIREIIENPLRMLVEI